MPRQYKKIEARAETSSSRDSAAADSARAGRVRAWEVVHACAKPSLIADLMDAQRAVGMHAFAITEFGTLLQGNTNEKTTPTSLIDSWNEVRKWRRQLDSTDAQIIHAHCFPAAMASVRSERPSVYDLRAFVEDQAITEGQCSDRSWLARSFRTAEQFVLARAGAIVLHSQRMKESCLQRGVDADDLFVIPDPLFLESQPTQLFPDASEWPRQAFGFREDVVAVFADLSPLADEAASPQMQATLLQAFAQVRNEVENARLFVTAGDDRSNEEKIRELARGLEVEASVFVLARSEAERALRSAQIVVSGVENPADGPNDRVSCMQPNRIAERAMLHARTLLAADSPANRDVSREGRGCLWYRSGDPRDLAHRLAFLARNQDFCRALAQAGHKHLLESRNPERVAKQYDQVYRHASANGKRDQHQSGSAVGVLVPNAVPGV